MMSDTFHRQGHTWWDEKGPFAPLHAINAVRMGFIKDYLPSLPFTALDIGCGGGLVCEPLARLGGIVTGVDESISAIQTAQDHATKMGLSISYQAASSPPEGQTYDVVCALEVIEHVTSPALFLESAIQAVKPGGILFVSSLNRTCLSWLKAIVAAEYILGWVPRGTHNWQDFITPGEIANLIRPHRWNSLRGLSYSWGRWHLSNSLDTNYIGCIRINP